MIHHGDCLEVMAAMEPESVDAIVTDPPYGLEFMGKKWDSFGGGVGWKPGQLSDTENLPDGNVFEEKGFGKLPIFRGMTDAQRATFYEFNLQWAEAAYRVAKPSAYLLAFGGTRTVHRMTCAIEDAGWIIRDMLVWAYASGFPKSKASLKPAWEPIVMARKPGPLRMLAIDECRIGVETTATLRSEGPDGTSFPRYGKAPGVYPNEVPGRWPANVILTDPIFDGGVEGVVGGGESEGMKVALLRRGATTGSGLGYGSTGSEHEAIVGYSDSGTYSRFFSIPEGGILCEWCGASGAGASSSQRNGSGVSVLGPAPTEGSSDGITPTPSLTTSGTEQTSWHGGNASTSGNEPSPGSRLVVPSRSGRVKSAAPSRTSSGTTTTTPAHWMCDSCADDAMRFSMVEQELAERDYPWAFLIPKAARIDREPVLPRGIGGIGALRDGGRPSMSRENLHPTVKPVDLMRHLVRLVTPAGGTVLDPFLGSGTTGLAAELEGFPWIGIEREAEYVAIAEARLNGTQRGLGLADR